MFTTLIGGHFLVHRVSAHAQRCLIANPSALWGKIRRLLLLRCPTPNMAVFSHDNSSSCILVNAVGQDSGPISVSYIRDLKDSNIGGVSFHGVWRMLRRMLDGSMVHAFGMDNNFLRDFPSASSSGGAKGLSQLSFYLEGIEMCAQRIPTNGEDLCFYG